MSASALIGQIALSAALAGVIVVAVAAVIERYGGLKGARPPPTPRSLDALAETCVMMVYFVTITNCML